MKDTLISLLSSSMETEILEFKEAKNQFDKNRLGKYFSALSNEANLKAKPSAWLLFGIDDNKKVVGTSISDKQIDEYKKEIAQNTSPRSNFIEVHCVECDDKKVLMLEIPPSPQGMPVSWKGHYYGRDGESLGALNINELENIRGQVNSCDWSARIVNEAKISDLSIEAIEKAKAMFLQKNPKFESEMALWGDITFLNKAKLCIKGEVTNTAILLLGKSESEHYLSPGIAKISWILRDRDNIEKDYEHFSCPFLLNVDDVFSKVRNLKYRYLQAGTLFPDEVLQYDPYIIREALNNCIAHQDYTLSGKINVVEKEDSTLIFSNKGYFIPETIENVIISDAPESKYRNPFLVNAMVNLNMIDTVGSGIKKMFVIQKNKFFPLPEYNFNNNSVQVQFTGKVIDSAYAEKLAQVKDLSLHEIVLLDKVAKQKVLLSSEIRELKKKKLIEGRKPSFHISSGIAKVTGEKANYIKQRGFKDDHYKKMILEYIDKYGSINKQNIITLIFDILPNVLNENQKLNKIKNIVYSMSTKDKVIKNIGTTRKANWVRSSPKTI